MLLVQRRSAVGAERRSENLVNSSSMRHFKIVIERHDDGFVAYPVGLRGVVVGQGDTLDEALADVRSAIQFHLETFDAELGEEEPLDIVLADLAIVA